MNDDSFEFFGTSKHAKYNIKEVPSELSKEYQTKIRVTSFVITSKARADSFEKQLETVQSIDAETYGLIFISVFAKEENERGYHTSATVSIRTLNRANERLVTNSPSGIEIYNGEYIRKSEVIVVLIERYYQSKRLQLYIEVFEG